MSIDNKKTVLMDMTLKVLETSEQVLKEIANDNIERACNIIHSRDRLLAIIQQVHDEVQDQLNDQGYKNQLNQLINKISELDQEIILQLQSYKKNVNNEIANLHKKKENFKGYNLNDLK